MKYDNELSFDQFIISYAIRSFTWMMYNNIQCKQLNSR